MALYRAVRGTGQWAQEEGRYHRGPDGEVWEGRMLCAASCMVRAQSNTTTAI